MKLKDVPFKIITLLKNIVHWEFVGKLFKRKGPNFERLVISVVNVVWDLFFNLVGRKIDNR